MENTKGNLLKELYICPVLTISGSFFHFEEERKDYSINIQTCMMWGCLDTEISCTLEKLPTHFLTDRTNSVGLGFICSPYKLKKKYCIRALNHQCSQKQKFFWKPIETRNWVLWLVKRNWTFYLADDTGLPCACSQKNLSILISDVKDHIKTQRLGFMSHSFSV